MTYFVYFSSSKAWTAMSFAFNAKSVQDAVEKCNAYVKVLNNDFDVDDFKFKNIESLQELEDSIQAEPDGFVELAFHND